jgi:MarR family 2-MHQ and catechol resistance regulon transcriptional repressor
MSEKQETVDVIRRWMGAFTMRSMEDWRRFVRAHGLSMPQAGLLMRLFHGGGCEVHAIGHHMDISSAAASQLVDRLVQGGLVVRTENPDDRRVRQITITAKGRALMETGLEERDRWVDELVEFIPADQRALVLRSLPILIDAEGKLAPTHPHFHPRDAMKACRDRQHT